ncbi:MAG: signal peptidase II, partial [Candidatus Desulfofervidaceae bacterium]|nr:signal peptidase II [Candidatus Desulfofervidaceae bacterium]
WCLDQITKWIVIRHLEPYKEKIKIGPLLNIIHIRNSGIAFGLWAGGNSGKQIFFIIFTLVAIMAILYYLYRETRLTLPKTWGCGLIIGGALGNLADRIIYGNVIDFIDCHLGGYHWPAFNIADSAVTIGTILLFFQIYQERR